LTDEQWELLGPLFPEAKRRQDGRRRLPAPNSDYLEEILWIPQTGAAWRFVPDEYPSPSTYWRRLKQWEEEGAWLKAWRTLLGALDEKGLLKWDEAFLDGSLTPAKKGAMRSAKSSAVKAQSGWYWETVKVFGWEFGWKVPPRQKLRLRTPRSTKSASHRAKAAAEAEASDRRPRLRLRSAAQAMEIAGY
jgi:transposase